MPTYEYACRACGHEFESFHSITASPLKKCPKCGKSKVERKISVGGGILFKGGGFYETDYRGDGYTKAAEAEKKAAEPAPVISAESAGAAASAPTDKLKPNSTPASKSDSPSATNDATGSKSVATKEPTPKDPPSKATHPSRIGRGAGNIVQATPPSRNAVKSKKKR